MYIVTNDAFFGATPTNDSYSYVFVSICLCVCVCVSQMHQKLCLWHNKSMKRSSTLSKTNPPEWVLLTEFIHINYMQS